jgi:septum formation protein
MLILASASPRRRVLLTQAGLRFDVLPAHIDESRRPNELPTNYVQRLALEKAQAIHALHPRAIVLGADTTVVLDNEILNKPTDRADAERMLHALSSRAHQVHTGIAVVTPTAQYTHTETTTVFFSHIPDDDLAYGIQGYAARWITRIEGDFFNVVGLPLAATIQLLTTSQST